MASEYSHEADLALALKMADAADAISMAPLKASCIFVVNLSGLM
jgi:hypothetical protein